MFGYIVGNPKTMERADSDRYHAAYCGLCREIGQRSGQLSRMTLTYDLTFLILVLSSLFEPEEQVGESRCVVHPARRHVYFTNCFSEYAADINVYLAYYKALDDYRDEKKTGARLLTGALSSPCGVIEARWPRQCIGVKRELDLLADIEREDGYAPDEAANAFGRLMGELFVYDEAEHFADTLRRFGCGLGRFVYMMDAALDYEKDRKSGAYNPLMQMERKPADMRDALTLLIGEATKEFEKLPLEKDLTLMRHILYSGVWQRYNAAFAKQAKDTNGAEGEKTDD